MANRECPGPHFVEEISVDSSEDANANRYEGQTADKDKLNHLALAEYNLRFTLELIRFADRKAQNLLRLTLAIFTVAFIGVPPAVMALEKYASQGGWRMILFVCTIVLYVACSACLLGAMVCIVRVIRPRREKNNHHKCLLFFDSIADMQLEEFLQMLRKMDYDAALTELGTQLYQSSKIARSKYAAVDTAIHWLLNGVLIGIVFALIMLVSAAWLLK